MHVRSSRTALSLGCIGALAAALGATGCSDRPEVQRSVAQVQRAVGEGAQGALANRPGARRNPPVFTAPDGLVQNAPGLADARPGRAPAVPSDPAVNALPHQHPVDDGVAFDPDSNHQDIATARSADHMGVAWHDAGEGMWFASTDLQGHAVGAPVQLRALVSDEESLSAPSVVAAGDGFGVAWVDAENGRVRFQMVGADGLARGASTIVHEGLADPQGVRLVYSGREFGVAAQLREGVYFARVDAQGRRLDAGRVFAEGESVDALDGLRWDGRGYSVGYSVSREGALEHREQRVDARRTVAFHLSRPRAATLFL